ncbi:MAG TPA: beta-galactosidase [Oligoflexus sp.]|uniref:beta-galactosidase n=1 Tax=Oligoflexus sp. TaxID=1971216 RepID=UPI002D652F28|nr:beta-galactosidase [Oligoflexus sp.]HYX37676.1 beta-galactosidase [Oligoflexus sp.]
MPINSIKSLMALGLAMGLLGSCSPVAPSTLQSARELEETSGGIGVSQQAFTIDGKPVLLRGGSLQWFRLPPSTWEDRILKFKAAGYNTIDMYVAWRNHEPQEGQFDFETFDVRRFLDLAKKHGLYVYFRPGPYITNEMDGGGVPAWVFAQSSKKTRSADTLDGTMNLRTNDADYLDAVARYWRELGKVVAPYLHSQGGPIILLGIENEYNWFLQFMELEKLAIYQGEAERDPEQSADTAGYLGRLRDIARESGFDVPITTCPGESGTSGMDGVAGIIPMPNYYGKDARLPELSAFKQLRDMHDPKKNQGSYVNFPSGTTETERSVGTLRRQIMGGLDGVFQFNIFGMHQEGRQNALALNGGAVNSVQDAWATLNNFTDFSWDRLSVGLGEPPVGFHPGTIDYYGAVSPSGVLRAKFSGLRRTNLFFDAFETLIAPAGQAKRSADDKLEGEDKRITVSHPELGVAEPDVKSRVHYWLDLPAGGALLGLFNPGERTLDVKPGQIQAFGEALPRFVGFSVPVEASPGEAPGKASSEREYEFMMPLRLPLIGPWQLDYSTSEILSLRRANAIPLLIVYGPEGKNGEMRLRSSGIQLLKSSGSVQVAEKNGDDLTLIWQHGTEPQTFLASARDGSQLEVLILETEQAGRTWFVPSAQEEILLIGPKLLLPQDSGYSLEMEDDRQTLLSFSHTPIALDGLTQTLPFRSDNGLSTWSVPAAAKGDNIISLHQGVLVDDTAEASPQFPTMDFKTLGDQPTALEYHGIYDGFVWYRAEFDLTSKDLKSRSLYLESVSDFAALYINGHYLLTVTPLGTEVNSASRFSSYKFDIPASILQKGRNVLTARVESWGHGSFMWPRGTIEKVKLGSHQVKFPGLRASIPALGFDSLKGIFGKTRFGKVEIKNWSVRSGLSGERQGLPMESQLQTNRKQVSMPLDLPRGAVSWYQTSFRKDNLLDTRDWSAPLALVIKGRSAKATIYVNGHLIGRWLSDEDWMRRGSWIRPVRDIWMNTSPDSFPVTTGILRDGDNILSIAFEDTSDSTTNQATGRIESLKLQTTQEERQWMGDRNELVPVILRKVFVKSQD